MQFQENQLQKQALLSLSNRILNQGTAQIIFYGNKILSSQKILRSIHKKNNQYLSTKEQMEKVFVDIIRSLINVLNVKKIQLIQNSENKIFCCQLFEDQLQSLPQFQSKLFTFVRLSKPQVLEEIQNLNNEEDQHPNIEEPELIDVQINWSNHIIQKPQHPYYNIQALHSLIKVIWTNQYFRNLLIVIPPMLRRRRLNYDINGCIFSFHMHEIRHICRTLDIKEPDLSVQDEEEYFARLENWMEFVLQNFDINGHVEQIVIQQSSTSKILCFYFNGKRVCWELEQLFK